MPSPLSIFIGLRYTRAKRNNHFISLISLISMLGITLGVIVLITVLSVLNGFDREIKKQIFGMIPPITISSYMGEIDNWQKLANIVQTQPDIIAVAPFATGQALLTNENITQPVVVTGILPDREKRISALSDKMVHGDLASLKAGHFGIALGQELAERLGVNMGDQVTVATQQSSLSISHIAPHLTNFTVIGIFRAGGGGLGFDSKLAFINLKDAQTLFELGTSVTALHASIKDLYAAPQIAGQLAAELSDTLRIGNWTEQLGDFIENISMTKTMMFFIFILIIAVAVFNLICTMVMAVKNKHADIAILRTLGATPQLIMAIFVVQGTAIGVGGIVLGVLGGVALATNVTALVNWIQHTFHIQLVSSHVYFVNYLPSELQWHDVWMISAIAFVLCLLATLYPAWNASRLEPAEALREET